MEDTQFLTVLILALTAAGAFWSAFASQQSANTARDAAKAAEVRSRKLETMKLINETEASPRFLELSETFRLRREAGTMTELSGSMDDAARSDRQEVMALLNHYELLSLSIRNGLLDERVYRDWMGTAFVRDWNAAADLIEAERWSMPRRAAAAPTAEAETAILRPVHASTRLDSPVIADGAAEAETESAVEKTADEAGAGSDRHYNPRVFEAFEALAHRWDPSAKRIAQSG